MVGAGRFERPTPCAQGSFGVPRKRPVFKRFGFKWMRRACRSLWNCEEFGGFRSYIFIYSPAK